LRKSSFFFVIFIIGTLVSISALQPVNAVNQFKQVFEINGTFTAGTDIFNVTLPSSLSNLDKSIAFLTFEYNGQNQHRDTFRSYNFTDLNTLTIYGNDDTPSANFEVGFHGTVFEFTPSSDVFVQHLEFTMAELLPEGEFEISIPIAINASTSFILPTGSHHDGFETTVGVEEFTKFRIINSTAYGLEVGNTPNTGDTVYHQSIIDLNVPTVTVQRGEGSLLSGELIDTVTPSAYNKTNSLLFVSYNTNGDFSQDPEHVAISATINGADDIIIQRVEEDGANNTVDYAWEIIEFDDGFVSVQHFIGSQADGTAVSLETIPTPVGNLTRSWAIGTVASPFGLGNGRSDSRDTGAFDQTTATITLNSTSEVELVRGDSANSYDVGLQVVEFLIQTFDFTQNILDVATAVDLSQNKNVTKLTSDITSAGDTVNTNAVFVIELSDTGEVLDVTSLNITKLNIDTVTALDETNFNISIGLLDSATILDLVDTNLFASIQLLDTTNVNDDLRLEITKGIIDSVITSDQVNFDITKLLLDVAIVVDLSAEELIALIEELDTVDTSDEVRLEITKALTDVATILDDPDFDIDKALADITTVTDQTDTSVIRQVLELDTVQANDEVRLEIIKAILDVITNSDELNFSLTKILTDTASVSDLIDSSTVFGENPLDQITANDLVILDITRQLSDVASAIDDLELVPTKVFLDTTSVSDTVDSSKDSDVTETDPVVTQDDLVIDVTKLIQDISTVQDNIVLLRILDIAIDDTVTVTDPSIFFTISTNQTAGGSGSASSGAGVPTFQRLIGLSILSELFNVAPKDTVPSDFVISTFGRDTISTKITNIETDQPFITWFQFEEFPSDLRFTTEIDNTRTIADPARFKNTALESFVLTVPLISCEGLDPFVTPVPCIDPLVYKIPVTFTISKGGVEFKEKHIVTVDATQRIPCDIICETVDFITQNYWWLAGILIMFMVMYFLRGTITKRGVRTARRVNKDHFTSFSANTPKRKFKRGKGR